MKLEPPDARRAAGRITSEDFARYWGADSLPAALEPFLRAVDTRHRAADKEELEEYLGAVLAKISKSTALRTEEENRALFERGWAGHLAAVRENCDLDALRPKYYGGLSCLLGEGCELRVCENRLLAADMQVLYVRQLMLTLLRDAPVIHEFGSGTGMNLFVMGSMAGEKTFIGYEWTRAGVELADIIGQKTGRAISGRAFDMLRPDASASITGDAVLTVASVEQLGENYDAFLDFLLAKKPALAVHIEPDTSPPESPGIYHSLALLYMRLRGYPQFFTQRLLELSQDKKLEIVLSRQLPWVAAFGNYRCVAWKPR